jgi:hypothetical protein
MKSFGRNKMFGVFDLLKYLTLTDDIDNLKLSSPHHYPLGEHDGLLSGSCWRPKKELLVIIGPL